MAYHRIAWSEKLAMGNEQIDAQHKKMIELIGDIPERTSLRDPIVLVEVLQHAATHFSDEEAYMARIQYPGLAAHKRQHKKLVRILSSYKKEYENGKTDLYSFKQFMFRWVLDHIMDEDAKIVSYVNSK